MVRLTEAPVTSWSLETLHVAAICYVCACALALFVCLFRSQITSMFTRGTSQPRLNLTHLTALTRLHASGKLSYFGLAPREPSGLHLIEKDLLPPNLASLCAASCMASLTPLLALKGLRKLSLASEGLPQLLPTAQGGSSGAPASTQGSSEQQQKAEAEAKAEEAAQQAAALAVLQERLPGVEVKVAKVLFGTSMPVDCHCYCSHTASSSV